MPNRWEAPSILLPLLLLLLQLSFSTFFFRPQDRWGFLNAAAFDGDRGSDNHRYEEFTRLAETRLAQNSLDLNEMAELTIT